MQFFDQIWRKAKQSRKLSLGPVELFFRFGRNNSAPNSPRTYPATGPTATPESGVDTENGYAKSSTLHHQSSHENAEECPQTAIIVGVGPGLGASLVRTCARQGMQVAVVSRNVNNLKPLVDELLSEGATVKAYSCDATNEKSVTGLFDLVCTDLGVPHFVVYSIQSSGPGQSLDMDITIFEECWRKNCLGGYIVAREASRKMVPTQRGTIVLIGSTSALLGRADHLNMAVGKAGLRAVSQVMAQELWSEGIHVVHAIIDANITSANVKQMEGPNQSLPDDISSFIYTLYQQPRSAWTSEIDIRPYSGAFWEHC